MNRILSVDHCTEAYVKAWKAMDVELICVADMARAIRMLLHDHTFLFVLINEDEVSDFLSLLPILRETTRLPIFVITSNYTTEKKIMAVCAGADAYDMVDLCFTNTVLVALALLKARDRLIDYSHYCTTTSHIFFSNDIILSHESHNVFVKGTRIILTKKEFDILDCLLSSDGGLVTHEQLLKRIWGEHYTREDAGLLWKTVNRIRKKLAEVCPERVFIRADRGVGYRFIIVPEEPQAR